MKVKRLCISQFRNYSSPTLFEFHDGVNWIVGPNASGKSSLLEAVFLLVFGRPFRSSSLKDVIHKGAPRLYIEGWIEKNGVEHRIRIESDGKKRLVHLNQTALPTLGALIGNVLGVLMAPEDRTLVKGTPSARRTFLDQQIAQANPLYFHHLVRYKRALAMRNALLRKRSLEAIEVWEGQMQASASFISKKRDAWVKKLTELANPLQQELGNETLKLSYEDQSERYALNWERQREREMHLGYTLTGPHREDIALFIDGEEARIFASEGQIRSIIASLRFAEWQQLKTHLGASPLFAIDDVGISLDKKRSSELFCQLQEFDQVFLTAPELPANVHADHVISLESSSIETLSST